MESNPTLAATVRLGDVVHVLDDASGRFGDAGVVFRLLRDRAAAPGPSLAMKTWSATPPPVDWLIWCALRLESMAHVPGLRAADRSVACLQSPVGLADALEAGGTAIIMPWIQGPSLADLVREQRPLIPAESLAAAASLAATLETLEGQGAWHGSVCESHILLPVVAPPRPSGADPRVAPLELVGLEAFHGMGWPDRPPADVPLGYRPPLHAVAGHTSPDRFPAAVQMALLLGWCDENLRSLAYAETFFAEEEVQRDCPRFTALQGALRQRWGDAPADFLAAAWASRSSAACPSFQDWTALLRTLSAEGDPTARTSVPGVSLPTAHPTPEEGTTPPPPPPVVPPPRPGATGPTGAWGSTPTRPSRFQDEGGPKTLLLDEDRGSRRRSSPGTAAEGERARTGARHATRTSLVLALVMMVVVLVGLVARILWGGGTAPLPEPAASGAPSRPVEAPGIPSASALPVEASGIPSASPLPVKASATPSASPLPVEASGIPSASPLPVEASGIPSASPLPVEPSATPSASPRPVKASATPSASPRPVKASATLTASPRPVKASATPTASPRPVKASATPTASPRPARPATSPAGAHRPRPPVRPASAPRPLPTHPRLPRVAHPQAPPYRPVQRIPSRPPRPAAPGVPVPRQY